MIDEPFAAIEAHDLDQLAAALRAGADPNAMMVEPPRWTALHAAIEELEYGGSVDALVLLLRHGAHVDLRDGAGDATPLLMAVFRGQIEAVRLLLTAGADPCVVGAEGDSPLRAAVEQHAPDTVDLLLRAGADRAISDAGGPSGMSALGRAAFELDVAMVKRLLRFGARSEALDADGRTARERMPARDASNAEAWDDTALVLGPSSPGASPSSDRQG